MPYEIYTFDDPAPADRVFCIECYRTGARWREGLTWRGEAADRALLQAQKTAPGNAWVLREVAQ